MVLALFRRSGNRQTIDRLHDAMLVAARRDTLYLSYGVADTVDGRYEMLVLHAVLMIRRLNAVEKPGSDVAQDLTNLFFRRLDAALREVGIGDTSVPKRVKKLAQAYYGRAGAYAAALASSEPCALAVALKRNVYAGQSSEGVVERLARYVWAVVDHFDTLPIDALLSVTSLYPDPATIH